MHRDRRGEGKRERERGVARHMLPVRVSGMCDGRSARERAREMLGFRLALCL